MQANSLRQITLPTLLLAGDVFVAFGGLSLGWWLRYETGLAELGLDAGDVAWSRYLPLLLVGVALLVGTFAQLGLYDERLLLRRYQSFAIVLKGTVFWLVAYLGVSLVLKFDPPISRLFVVLAFICVAVAMFAWRTAFYLVVRRGSLLERIQLRVAVLGWNRDADRLVREISQHEAHPYQVVGLVADRHGPDPADPDLPALVLGSVSQLSQLLALHRIDILIAAHLDYARADLNAITTTCERAYVDFKIIPSVFQVFISGLRLQTIGNLPVLGVEDLAITRLFNRALKRTVDLTGAALGLVLSAPIIAVLALLIRRESPGPVLFRQIRLGANHRPFAMLKLRSMHPEAPARDHQHQSTRADDPRLLRIGAFMRRWNLDELPQFWNVLRGDMSLVGPRPERPYHADRLADVIPHYVPRHVVKPGMTGWAQVNNLRGDSDLTKRIQYDIYYIENWSPWLDLQILLLTLVRWRAPA
jgi:exopolysaccharide biosynthesis polyprenyl glycosylphosphotransferase